MQVPNIAMSAKRFCIEIYSASGKLVGVFDQARHLTAVPEATLIMFEDDKKTPHSFQGFSYHIWEVEPVGGQEEEESTVNHLILES